MEAINTVLFWVFVFVLAWQAYILLFNRGVPNIRTIAPIGRAIIARLRADREKRGKTDYTIIDLGSAAGALSAQIARAMPEAQVIGLEIAWGEHWRARVKQMLFGPDNIRYIRTDFFEYDLSGADAVVLFMLDTAMPPVRDKLRAELKKGTLVTSNKFPLGGDWEPLEVVEVESLYPHQRRLYIYRA